MTPIFAELHRWRAMPFRWGESDCQICIADWIVRCGHPDPAADIRMAYGSAGECQRLTRFFTAPLDAVGPRYARCGLVRTDAPVRGDVALMQAHIEGHLRPVGGLCLGPIEGRVLWAAKSETGVAVIAPPQILASWSVGYVDP